MVLYIAAESFTITLGAQMKAMHNLRLVAADIFEDVCKYPEELEVALPQRLQVSSFVSFIVFRSKFLFLAGDLGTFLALR